LATPPALFGFAGKESPPGRPVNSNVAKVAEMLKKQKKLKKS
jgi:hypothetical protein